MGGTEADTASKLNRRPPLPLPLPPPLPRTGSRAMALPLPLPVLPGVVVVAAPAPAAMAGVALLVIPPEERRPPVVVGMCLCVWGALVWDRDGVNNKRRESVIHRPPTDPTPPEPHHNPTPNTYLGMGDCRLWR